jgi:hypothetical protein
MAYFAARKIYGICSDIMSSFEREQIFSDGHDLFF